MALTAYISTCDGGTKPTRTAGNCPESARILGFAAFKPSFDIETFFDDSGGTAPAEDAANWDALVTSGNICFLVKEAGGDLPEPAENTVQDLRRNNRVVDFKHAITVQMYKYEGNENVLNYLNDNQFGLIVFTEDYKAYIYVDSRNNFVRASAVAKHLSVDGEVRVQVMFDLTTKSMPQVQDFPIEILS